MLFGIPTLPRLAATPAGGLLLAVLVGPVAADEYCVSCTGPDASYRCEIADTPAGAGSDPRAQLMCITELARTGGHDSCSVTRTAVPPCPGETRTVAAPLGAPAALPPQEPLAGTDVPPQEPADEAEGTSKVPRTVEEMAKDTVKSSQEGLKKTGEAVAGTAKSAGEKIGNAAKKTWNCLTSLFKDC